MEVIDLLEILLILMTLCAASPSPPVKHSKAHCVYIVIDSHDSPPSHQAGLMVPTPTAPRGLLYTHYCTLLMGDLAHMVVLSNFF